MYDITDEGHNIVTLTLGQISIVNSVVMYNRMLNQFSKNRNEVRDLIHFRIRSRVDKELRKILDTG